MNGWTPRCKIRSLTLEGTYRRFKFEVLRVVTRNDLPGYSLAIRPGSEGEPLVHMLKREFAGEGEPQNWKPSRQASRPRPMPQNETESPRLLRRLDYMSPATMAGVL